MRTIKQIAKAFKVNMGGIFLDQALPYQGVDQIDPFLLVHHWADSLRGGQKQKNVGVPPHPHRGFAPVTLVFKGAIHHRDSEGNSDIVKEGGTQWMNSGNGIVHSERPTKELAENGGEFEIIQFWVNAPASKKGDKPSYQPLSLEETIDLEIGSEGAKVGLVAGEMNGKKGKINTYSDLLILRLELEANSEVDIPLPKSFNAFLYVLDGETKVNDLKHANDKDLVWFNNDGENINIKSKTKTRAILLSGMPIGESVSTYGPFVMNTEEEIAKAIHDYQKGKMGVLVENFD